MTSDEPTDTPTDTPTAPTRRRSATRPSGPPAPTTDSGAPGEPTEAPAKKTAAKKTAAKKTATKKTAAAKTTAKKTTKAVAAEAAPSDPAGTEDTPAKKATKRATAKKVPIAAVTFQPPDPAVAEPAPAKKTARKSAAKKAAPAEPAAAPDTGDAAVASATPDDETGERPSGARRRRRGGRGRGRGGAGGAASDSGTDADDSAGLDDSAVGGPDDGAGGPDDGGADDEGGEGQSGTGTRRRRRRRRRGGGGGGDDEAAPGPDDPPNTVVRVRQPRAPRDRDNEVRGVSGSTRLEARKQRRREGREAGRRPTILTEAEFLARREAVERVMAVRQTKGRTQVAVLEDGVLVEHFVTHAEASSYVGNVYLGRVQNVLPSMEAAFVDVGRGRNAVLYAGEVNWDASALEGQPRRIELALKPGQPVLVQVSKDPMGHKGARLTSQISLPGRYVAYVPEGRSTGISRKLPETERARLKSVLKKVTPEGAGVIVRTAAEGASEEELERDIRRLQAQWEAIQKKAESADPPELLYGEPDLVIRVIRDVFNEDFTELLVSGDDEWDTIEQYVGHVAPDLAPRLRKWTDEKDIFAAYRVDEQLVKALDRKVWLPSGGYLVIDRTEAMIVVDVNTGKFTGRGGNLEETVTKNNLEAAEEIVRQLRLRDLGGIIVIDFVDMVLESNRDLVLRRLVECLGRDRTRHQVAEVTSLGLVQMTRKRVGQGLLEAFSETCPDCNGRGVKIHLDGPPTKSGGGNGAREGDGKRARRSRGGGGGKAGEAGPDRPAESGAAAELALPEDAPKDADKDSDTGPKPPRKKSGRRASKSAQGSPEGATPPDGEPAEAAADAVPASV